MSGEIAGYVFANKVRAKDFVVQLLTKQLSHFISSLKLHNIFVVVCLFNVCVFLSRVALRLWKVQMLSEQVTRLNPC